MNDADVTDEGYFDELADPAQPVAVSKLTNLSGMSSSEAARFAGVWLALDDGRRKHVVEQIASLAEDNVELDFDAVLLIALGDEEDQVRLSALRGLWEHEGRDLIDPLIGLLETDADAAVRAEAALALGRFVLMAEFGTLKDADAERIEEALCAVIADAGEAVEVRGRALESIGARSGAFVADLIRDAYEAGEQTLQLSAVHAMGRSCDETWLALLFDELENDEAAMRYEAAVACGAMASAEAVAPLAALLYDDDPEVRGAAINALGEIGGEEAKRTLEDLLDEADEATREAVLAAVAEADFSKDPLGVKARE